MTLSVAQVSSVLGKIPSPSKSQYHLGPIPIRMYALCIVGGILVAVWLGDKRWQARGGPHRSGTSRSGRSRSAWSAVGSTT